MISGKQKTENGKPELHIDIGFKRGGTFTCPVDGCGETVTAYDTSERTWRHLNFFQYKTFIHARQPRIKCKEHGVKTVDAPWARPGSGFTLLFEGWCLELAKHVPVSVTAEMVDENDTRLWRFIKHANESVDSTRKAEAKKNSEQKGTKYLWLKNEKNLSEVQKKKKESLMKLHHYFDHQYTNAILEGMNSIIQNIKRRARGFRNTEFFKTMIYLVCGKLPIEKYAVMV